MNIHEYQAKALFKEFGVPVQDGVAVKSPEEFDAAIASVPGENIVVKSQIHAGGRGKGVFVDGFKGGVKFVPKSEAAATAKRMLGNTIVTKQTGPQGRVVGTIFFTEALDIDKEYYLSILMDRASSKVAIVASVAGGMEIEKGVEEYKEELWERHPDQPGHIMKKGSQRMPPFPEQLNSLRNVFSSSEKQKHQTKNP